MNNRPLYENLDTSFVNLSALVRYLRHREFIGQVKIELNNYQAEIALKEGNKLQVREHDKISGRVSEGEEAFQRILIRAREVGGTIHVYQKVETVKKVEEIREVKEVKKVEVKPTTQLKNENLPAIPKPVEPIKKPLEIVKTSAASATTNGVPTTVVEMPKKPEPNGLKLPFELTKKSRNTKLSPQDWQTLLGLTGELLGTIDKSLATAKLDFKSAFSKARSEISADYPFLSPTNKIFDYTDGKVAMTEQVSAKLFVTGIIQSLRKILDKLGANPKFAEVYRNTVQKLLALLNQRQAYYEKFSITPQLKKILGV